MVRRAESVESLATAQPAPRIPADSSEGQVRRHGLILWSGLASTFFFTATFLVAILIPFEPLSPLPLEETIDRDFRRGKVLTVSPDYDTLDLYVPVGDNPNPTESEEATNSPTPWKGDFVHYRLVPEEVLKENFGGSEAEGGELPGGRSLRCRLERALAKSPTSGTLTTVFLPEFADLPRGARTCTTPVFVVESNREGSSGVRLTLQAWIFLLRFRLQTAYQQPLALARH